MKKLLFTIIYLSIISIAICQTQGISYQAVIISADAQQIPGYDIEGDYLPNYQLMVRFTILDAAETVDYQEEHQTTTDAYGIINLIIGQGLQTTNSPKAFNKIDWDGNPKYLKVDISLDVNTIFYTDFSFQELNFIPYAYHKNITATGSLTVDGSSSVQDLLVNTTANVQGGLQVNNKSNTYLTGSLQVDKATTLNDQLDVNAPGNIRGQLTINADIDGNQSNDNSYPLFIRGSTQGISIKIDGSRSSANNYVLFSDEGGVQGRIEGEDAEDVLTDPKYYIENASYIAGVVKATIGVVGASTSSTVCVGLGACVTTPTPSLIIAAAAKLVIAVAQLASYNVFRFANAGVVYKTKGADYAEWLPKLNPAETFYPGQVVGIKGGFVTKNIADADLVMVVSTNPIVLGNTPNKPEEHKYAKIAFLGQVPVRMAGIPNAGDYAVADTVNTGGAIAVAPNNIKPTQIPYIIGMVWPNSEKIPLGFANVAVNINTTNMANYHINQQSKILSLQTEVNSLNNQISIINDVLGEMFPEYQQLTKNRAPQNINANNSITPTAKITPAHINNNNITLVYANISKHQIIESVELAKQILTEQNYDLNNDPIFKRLINDPDYLDIFAIEMQQKIQKHIDADFIKNSQAGINVIKIDQ